MAGDGRRETLATVEEATWGTTPASAGTLIAYMTGLSGGWLNTTFNRSAALDADLDIKNHRAATAEASYTVSGEYAIGDVFELYWLEGLFGNDRSAVQTITATDISFTSPDTIATVAGDFSIFPAYSWVRVAGTASNDGEYFITASSASSLTIGGGTTVTTESAGASMTLDQDGHLTPGSTAKFYTNERDAQDLTTNRYMASKGAVPISGTIGWGAEDSFINWDCGFGGKAPLAGASSTAFTGGPTAATTNTQIEPGTGATAILIDNAAAAACQVSNFSLSMSSPVTFRRGIGEGSLDPCALHEDEREWTVNLGIVANDAGLTYWNTWRKTGTAASLSFRLVDAEGNIQRWRFPQMKCTAGDKDNGGEPALVIPFQFTLEKDATEGFIACVTNFNA